MHGALRLDLNDSMGEFESLVHKLLDVLNRHESAFDTLSLVPEGAAHITLADAAALDSASTLQPLLRERALLPLHLSAMQGEHGWGKTKSHPVGGFCA